MAGALKEVLIRSALSPIADIFSLLRFTKHELRAERIIAPNPMVVTLAQVADDLILDAAYEWLCHRRRDYPANADVWSVRFRWEVERPRLKEALLSGQYYFSPLSRVARADGEVIHLWSARDALVLKALTLVLGRHLPISRRCVHVKGHGGSKAAVRQVLRSLDVNRFVLRTDVKAYYESIDHFILLEQLACYIKDRSVLNLLWQYMHRVSEWGGLFRVHDKGISRGCPLSPLIGALFLDCLDRAMQRLGLFYVRFMDDVLVLAPTRWKLKRAVKRLNDIFRSLKLEKHPDKTFIGRADKGFDFLGYHFSPDGLSVANETLEKFVERATRLYERERGGSSDSSSLGQYVRRWLGWANCGLERPPVIGQNFKENALDVPQRPDAVEVLKNIYVDEWIIATRRLA